MDMKPRVVIGAFATIYFFLLTSNAYAAIDSSGLLDTVLNRYILATSTWGTVITKYASWLFWTLALISMAWTFGLMVLRQADIGEFFSEFVRFTIFTGFYWWLLINGPRIANAIMDSMKEIGKAASGSPLGLTPSSIIDIGFAIYGGIIVHSAAYDLMEGIASIIVGLVVLIALALVSVNMLILLISCWILAYAGIFFLGFGGSRWTSEMALGYYRTVINLGGQILTMVLLVGIGQSILQSYADSMSPGETPEDLGIILVISIVLLMLVNKVPSLIGSLAMGGGTGALGGGFGAGHAIGAMTMAATAGASAAAGVVSVAANTSGAVKAVQAAYQKAQSAESAVEGVSGAFADAAGGESAQKQDSSSPLAAAMGDPASGTGESVKKDSGDTSKNDPPASSESAKASKAAAPPPPAGAGSTGKSQVKSPREQAKPVRLALGTVSNLIGGASSMAKSAFDARVESTLGARLAGLLDADMASAGAETPSQKTDGNTISAGKTDDVDPAAEVAAFRDAHDEPGSEENEPSKD